MNKQQIKAELRRSACEDKDPYWELMTEDAWRCVCDFGKCWLLTPDDCRTLFLLVAEAL